MVIVKGGARTRSKGGGEAHDAGRTTQHATRQAGSDRIKNRRARFCVCVSVCHRLPRKSVRVQRQSDKIRFAGPALVS